MLETFMEDFFPAIQKLVEIDIKSDQSTTIIIIMIIIIMMIIIMIMYSVINH